MKSSDAATEGQLRTALRAHLSTQGPDGTVIEEMALERGTARIDLALVGDRLLGFEIKSDLDGPERLVNQIHVYNRVFDEIYLVCSHEASAAFEEIIPPWWGIFAAERSDEGLTLGLQRPAAMNLRRDAMSLALLLRLDELRMAFARHFGNAANGRANRTQLQGQLVASLTLAQLTSTVTKALRARHSADSPAW